ALLGGALSLPDVRGEALRVPREGDQGADPALPYPLEQILVRAVLAELRDDRLADEALQRHAGLVRPSTPPAGDRDDHQDQDERGGAPEVRVRAAPPPRGEAAPPGAAAGGRTPAAALELAGVAARDAPPLGCVGTRSRPSPGGKARPPPLASL